MRKLIALSGLILLLVWPATSTAKAKHQSYVTKGLLCIHDYEGAWNDPNPPYWGGLQMDMNFQNAYGYRWVNKHAKHKPARKIYFKYEFGSYANPATADKWPIWAQMMAGRHGYFSRGWQPWYNTAHLCGLI